MGALPKLNFHQVKHYKLFNDLYHIVFQIIDILISLHYALQRKLIHFLFHLFQNKIVLRGVIMPSMLVTFLKTFVYFSYIWTSFHTISIFFQTSRSTSPRRLCKQVALESPPPQLTSDPDQAFYRRPSHNPSTVYCISNNFLSHIHIH